MKAGMGKYRSVQKWRDGRTPKAGNARPVNGATDQQRT
jgi:hypothetical protein